MNMCGNSLQQSTQRHKTKLGIVRRFQKLIYTETVATEVLVSTTADDEGYLRTLAYALTGKGGCLVNINIC